MFPGLPAGPRCLPGLTGEVDHPLRGKSDFQSALGCPRGLSTDPRTVRPRGKASLKNGGSSGVAPEDKALFSRPSQMRFHGAVTFITLCHSVPCHRVLACPALGFQVPEGRDDPTHHCSDPATSSGFLSFCFFPPPCPLTAALTFVSRVSL